MPLVDHDAPLLPDGKDWTWVLEQPCRECGFDAARVAPLEVAGRLRANAAAWPAVLAGAAVRDRPDRATWSPLEYGCHVRDVLRLFDVRLRLMLEQDDPLYANWDQDATAVQEQYGTQDPAVVSYDLLAAADVVCTRFEGLDEQQWQRSGRRSDGARFTVVSFARYLLHDPVHHLHDVTR